MRTELSDGEWVLMNKLWEAAPRTITQLTAALKEETGWSKHTIISMLSRLGTKGAVEYRDSGRAKEYFPVLRRSDAARRETEHFLEKVYNGRLGVMLNAMVDSEALSSEDVEELAEILKRAKGGSGDG